MKTIKMIFVGLAGLFFIEAVNAQSETKEKSETETVSLEQTEPKFPSQDRMSETPNQAGFHIGLRYQPVFGKVDFNTYGGNTVNATMQASHGFALSLNYYFNNWIGTHLEAMWSKQQFNFEDAGSSRTVNLSYLNFPIMASLNSNLGHWFNVNIAAGPYFAVNTGADVEVSNNQDGSGTAEGVLAINPVDIGVAYGGGVDFAFGPERGIHLRTGYRGTSGLLSLQNSRAEITENQFTLVAEGSRLHTSGFYLGVMFKL